MATIFPQPKELQFQILKMELSECLKTAIGQNPPLSEFPFFWHAPAAVPWHIFGRIFVPGRSRTHIMSYARTGQRLEDSGRCLHLEVVLLSIPYYDLWPRIDSWEYHKWERWLRRGPPNTIENTWIFFLKMNVYENAYIIHQSLLNASSFWWASGEI